jgi:ribose transport system substrate-binding protein
MGTKRERSVGRPAVFGLSAVLALVLLALGLSACGGGSGSSSTVAEGTEGGEATKEVAETTESPSSSIDAEVAALYKGDFDPPPTAGPKAVGGKNVWYISCGQLFAACQEQTKGFEEAARELGWNLTVQDGKADPSTAAGLIRQGVAANVDAIGISGFDCPNIKGALEEAKSAGIPVVSIEAADCNDPAYGGSGPELFVATRYRNDKNFGDFKAEWSEARIPYIVAKAGPEAKVVMVTETSYAAEQAAQKAVEHAFETDCPECTLYEVPFTFAQVPNPATQIWTTGIQSHPDANVVEYGVDALMSLGLQTAVEQAPQSELVVGGGEGFTFNFELIREGVQTFSVAIPYHWITWGLADSINRVLAGEPASSLPSEGTGWQYVDKEHNLPAPGKPYEPPVDYRAAYRAIWKG